MPSDAQVGPYRVIERIGAGGMGEVFLAEDPRLGRQVALKRLTLEGVGADEQLRRLLNEGTAAAALNHPNIAGIYDVLEADGVAHIVMEYVPGETLASKLLRGPMPLDRVVQIGLQLCDGLAAAHARHITHRDLKPSNVMVTPDGQVKILDFGLAERRGAAPADMTRSAGTIAHALHGVAGTPAYMSPEQLLGRKTDGRTDIYSLGVTLYQLATGRTPFEGDSFMSVALSILTGPRPDVGAELGPALGPIVGRALEREPSHRYQTVGEMRRDLETLAALAAETPTLPTESGLRVPGPITRRERKVFGWVATGALILLLSALVWWAIARDTQLQAGALPVVAVMPFETSSRDPRDTTLGFGVGDALLAELAGNRSIVVVPARTDGERPTRSTDVTQVARLLGASFVVDGSVQVVGDQVRLNVRVVRPDGTAAQGFSAEGARRDLLGLQRSVAASLVHLFAPIGSADAHSRTADAPATSVDTLQTYSEARALLERHDVEGNVTRAIGLLERCIATDPSFALGYAALTEAYWRRYQDSSDALDVERAQKAAQRALQLDPAQPDVRYALALAYNATGQRDRAIDELRASITAQPGRDMSHRLLGEILAERGELESGIDEIKRAITLRPGYAENYTRLGVVYRRAGRYDDALHAFEVAVRLRPDSADDHNRLGAAYLLTGDERNALAEFRQAVRIGGVSPAYGNIGLLEYRAGRYGEAVKAYEHAVLQRPNDPVMWRNMGDAYAKVGRGSDAARAYEHGLAVTDRMLTVDAQSATTLSTRAVLLAKLGRREDARAAAAAGAAQAPADPDVLYDRAVVLAVIEDPQAVAVLGTAIAAGYPADDVLRDDEWDRLRTDDGFRRATAAR